MAKKQHSKKQQVIMVSFGGGILNFVGSELEIRIKIK